MGFYVRFDDIRTINEITGQQISKWQEELTALQNAMKKVIDLDSFQGQAADSVKTYYSEIHYLLLSAIGSSMMDYMAKVLLYWNGYYNIDGDIHTKLNEDTLNKALGEYDSSLDKIDTAQTSLQSVLNSVSDIFCSGVPAVGTLEYYHDAAKEKIIEIRDKVIPYEEGILNNELTNLRELIENTISYIREYKNGDRNIMIHYSSGDYIHDENIYKLAISLNKAQEYQQIHQKELEEAISQQEKVYEQLQAEYEAEKERLAKERADQGTAQVIMGVFTVGVGAAAIILTAGAAAPVVVTAAISGTCTVAYGVSETIEGSQHVYYGLNGDPYTSAFNPLRDTVFMGNQKAYSLWGNINMTVASLCVPIGKSVQGLQGVQAVKSAAVTVAKEVTFEAAEDYVAGKVAGNIIEYAGVDSATGQTLVQFGTNFMVGKVSDATVGKVVDQKIIEPVRTKQESIQVKIDAEATGEGFAGLMNENDAEAYKSKMPATENDIPPETDPLEIEISEIQRDANASGKGLSGLMDEADAKRMDEWTDSQEKPQKILDMEREEAEVQENKVKKERREKILDEITKNTPDEPQRPYSEAEEEREKLNDMKISIGGWQTVYGQFSMEEE